MSVPGETTPVLFLTSAAEFKAAYGATSEQTADLQSFREMLEEWGDRMNLVGPSAMAEFWLRHAFDSAQLLHVEQSALRWVDIGTGAGFPGIVLAILLKSRVGASVHLVESRAKRAGFLQHVVSTLSLPADVYNKRAEDLTLPAGVEMVTARACAPLSSLFNLTAHFFESGAEGLFLKGRHVQSELLAARQSWMFGSALTVSRSDPEGRIVRVRGLKPRV